MAETALQIMRRAAKIIRGRGKPTGPSGPLPGTVTPETGVESAVKAGRKAAEEKSAREAAEKLIREAGGGVGPAPALEAGAPATTPGLGRILATPEEQAAVRAARAGMTETPELVPGLRPAKLVLSEAAKGTLAPEEQAAVQTMFQRTAAAINLAGAQQVEVMRRGARAHDVTEQAAMRLLRQGRVTVEGALSLEPGTAVNPETALALRKLAAGATNLYTDLERKALTGEAVDEVSMRLRLGLAMRLQQAVAGVRAEAGRATESFKIEVPGESDLLFRKAVDTAARVAQGMSAQQIAEITSRASAAEKPKLLAKAAMVPEALYEVWINGLLSGPLTHARNLVSNTVMAWTIAERAMAGAVGRGREAVGFAPGVQPGEATAQMFGLWAATGDAVRLMGRAFRGESAFGGAPKYAPQIGAIRAERLGIDPSQPLGMAADYLGVAIRAPGSAMRASDEMFKTLWYRAELYAQAYRKARLDPAIAANPEAFAKQVADLALNPTSEMQVAALDFARTNTFTKELGTSGLAYLQWVHSNPLMRLLVPFVSTPTNVAKQAFQRFPGLNLLSETNLRDLAAGGAQADLATARLMTSGLLLYYIGGMVASGKITGSGANLPPSYKQWLSRNYGWQPDSAWDEAEQKYVSLRPYEPVASIISAMANYIERFRDAPEHDVQTGAFALMASVAKGLGDTSMMSGLVRAVDAIQGPGLKAWMRQTGSSLVPFSGAVRQTSRAFDPELKEVYSFWDAIQSTWQSNKLYPVLGDDGYPIIDQTPLPAINPFRSKIVTDQPYAKEMAALGIRMRPVPYALFGSQEPFDVSRPTNLGRGITLTPEQRHRFGELRGHEVTDPQGRTLIQALNDEVLSERFRGLPVPSLAEARYSPRTRRLESIIDKFHDETVKRTVGEFRDIEEKRAALEAERNAVRRGQPAPNFLPELAE